MLDVASLFSGPALIADAAQKWLAKIGVNDRPSLSGPRRWAKHLRLI